MKPTLSSTPVSTHPVARPGSTVFTATGYFLVAAAQTDVPSGYVLVRRAERPMAQARLIRVSDIIAATVTTAGAALTSAGGVPAPAC
jgi:hypothetical protein